MKPLAHSAAMDDAGFAFGIESNGTLRLTMIRSSTNLRVATTSGLVTSGRWMQLAFTWDGTVGTAAAGKLFIDGVEQVKATSADGSGTIGSSGASNKPLRLGNVSFDTMSGSLNGKIAYVAVYSGRLLTASELNQLDSQLPIH